MAFEPTDGVPLSGIFLDRLGPGDDMRDRLVEARLAGDGVGAVITALFAFRVFVALLVLAVLFFLSLINAGIAHAYSAKRPKTAWPCTVD